VKVYTIGVGTTGLAPVIVRDMFGREVVQRSHVTMDEEELKRIAAETGGLYFNAKDKKGLETALDSISKLETTQIDQSVWFRNKELFPPFLASGALAILAAMLLAPKGRRTMI